MIKLIEDEIRTNLGILGDIPVGSSFVIHCSEDFLKSFNRYVLDRNFLIPVSIEEKITKKQDIPGMTTKFFLPSIGNVEFVPDLKQGYIVHEGTFKYDSTEDTRKHIRQVRDNIEDFMETLYVRGRKHDISKLESPEKELFDEMTPVLKSLSYGSEQYQESLQKMKPALQHHYENNSHHPEFYSNGIDGMNLLDLVEMWCDWNAAVQRTKDGDIVKSLEINRKRFNISDQLYNILKNSVNGE